MIAVIAAMEAEIEEFVENALAVEPQHWGVFTYYRATLAGRDIVLARSGCGKVLSAMVTQRLIDVYSPEKIIFTGVAGAINSQYEIGDVVVSKDCVQHDMDCCALGFKRGEIPYADIHAVEADSSLVSFAMQYRGNGHKVHLGRILTGDQFMTNAEMTSHQYLAVELQGDAIDMESASVGLVAKSNNLPFVIIRTISDKANGSAAVDFNAFLPIASKNSYGMVRHILERCP